MKVLESIDSIASKVLSIIHVIAVLLGITRYFACSMPSYAVNALHCDVCSLCMPSGVHCCLFHWFLGQCFWVEVHPYMTGFLHFLAKCFFCNLYMRIVHGHQLYKPQQIYT